jgi:leader peptidase (prepilin peptidase)/N-methyltransferase
MDGTFLAFFSTWAFGVFVLLAGLCIGSFLNVCIWRLPSGKSLVRPASHCTSCQAPIAWYDNVPVASYFILGGRCRRCGAAFSARYMIVELATGLLWFGYWLAYFKLGIRTGADHPGIYLVHMVLVSALVVSGVIDYDRKEIFTAVTNFALGAGLVGSLVWPAVQRVGAYGHGLADWTGWERTDALVAALVGAAVGAGLVVLTRFLGTAAFRKEAMGVGDAYLMAAVGGVLGWEAAVLVFLVGPFLGLPYGVWQVLRRPEPPVEAQAEAPAPSAPAEPDAPRLGWGAFVAALAGLALLVAAAATAGEEPGLTARSLLAAGLVAMGVAFLLARHEGGGDMDDQPAAAPSRHEMPYGPFLALAAGVVMLIQDPALGRFGPGVEALWRTLIG